MKETTSFLPLSLAISTFALGLLCAALLPARPEPGARADEAPADLVVLGARIWTGDPARPEAEAAWQRS
mgnify:CR=1 FL=1